MIINSKPTHTHRQNGLQNNELECREGMRKTEKDHEPHPRLRTTAPSLHPVTQRRKTRRKQKNNKCLEQTFWGHFAKRMSQ
ncbi:hypothetical protein TNIN_500711 [Trichonephila inaurata madagascariensis]|uniref:Uncharacterized protein n=1 Tax=Trichonephila inaurata madagascariensis TaxID=2747483 RepID=A0A8X6YNT9_9ARAC|nr:hypothetical protein TNIN_500711 [Trichonephila inaurata madagascariensis]